MSDYLNLNSDFCMHCYKCIRECPIKSIEYSSGHAGIIADECVLCGTCYVQCPQKAKTIRSDVDKVKRMFKERVPVYASVAPSFLANYKNIPFSVLAKAMRTLGFEDVFETAEGATVVANRYDEMAQNREKSVIISSCCPSVNTLIQKHYPEALEYLAEVLSPMQAHGKALKEKYPGCKTVFIGPCIAKKAEADNYPEHIDAVLTFGELEDWMSGVGINLWTEGELETGGKARVFPTSGGVLKTMLKPTGNYNYLVTDGIKNCIAALKSVISGDLTDCFIEMSACEGSCVAGPAMRHTHGKLADTALVYGRAHDQGFDVEQPNAEQLKKDMPNLEVKKDLPSKSAIDAVLRQIGKTEPEHELNCGCCGYETCRDKAAAVLAGKADKSMCLPFLTESARSLSETIVQAAPDAIIVLNEDFIIQQVNAAAQEMFNVSDAYELVGKNIAAILDPIPFVDAIEGDNSQVDKPIKLDKYGKYALQTIIYDKNYSVLICLMRDITEKMIEKEAKDAHTNQAVELADNVIAKHMRTVQEIASLLGETTAETKVALTKLKDTLKND